MASDELTTGQAAALLGVSQTTVISYVDKGLLACRLLPSGHRRFERSEVEALRSQPQPKGAA